MDTKPMHMARCCFGLYKSRITKTDAYRPMRDAVHVDAMRCIWFDAVFVCTKSDQSDYKQMHMV